MADEKQIAYIMKGFPRLSETFIVNEIHRLESLGLRLRLYAVKPSEAGPRHAIVDRIRAPLVVLPRAASISERSLAGWLIEHAPRFARAHLALALARPLRYARVLARAIAMSLRYRTERGRPRKVFIKEFVQAGAIAHDLARAPDIGHLHGHFCHGATTITWFVAALTGLPFSFTAHAKDIYQARLNPGDLLERKLGAARFVATCTCANESVLRARTVRPEAVHTVYHGLDVELFRPQPAIAREAPPVILAIGRFVAKKGYPVLIDALALLAAQGRTFRARLIGEDGDDAGNVRRRIAAHRIEHLVELLPPVPQEALVAQYARASVFVLPCQVMADGDRDGIPNVLVEAMAMGLAVVSTHISGIPELVTHERDGLLVEPGSSEAIAHALDALLAGASLRARLGAAARATVLERFDARKTTRTLATLFRESIAA